MRFCSSCGASYGDETAYCPNDGAATRIVEDAPPAQDPLIGTVVGGRYRVERSIGEGGMGIVYRAVHTVLGKPMALKVLRGNMAKDEAVVQRFVNEARAASEIGHQNIIDITDFGQLGDASVYFAMELIEGESLSQLIARGGSIPMDDALHIIRQIASALGAAHARGIVHRDLKPDNIMLVRRGNDSHFVKVLDFGIAKVGNATTRLTQTGMVFGTPHYMSPEQAAGQSVDHRTDIYALGVIMYEMFTGRVPFDADTFMGILTKHMFEPPVRPSHAGEGHALGAIEDIILRALAKKPEQRHQSMQDLLVDLDTVVGGGTVRIGAPAASRPSVELADALEPPSRTEYGLRSRPPLPPGMLQPRTLLLAVAVGGGLAVLAVGAVVFFTSGSESPRTSPVSVVAAAASAGASPAERAVAQPPAEPQQVARPGDEPGPSAVPVATVEIVSEPAGAEVSVGGAIVGTTPAVVARPKPGETTAVLLRLAGYVTTSAMVSERSERVVVSLEADRPRASTDQARPSLRPGSRGGQQPTRPARTARPDLDGPRRNNSEMLDPWGN